MICEEEQRLRLRFEYYIREYFRDHPGSRLADCAADLLSDQSEEARWRLYAILHQTSNPLIDLTNFGEFIGWEKYRSKPIRVHSN